MAASRATPLPVAPPPITRMSNSCNLVLSCTNWRLGGVQGMIEEPSSHCLFFFCEVLFVVVFNKVFFVIGRVYKPFFVVDLVFVLGCPQDDRGGIFASFLQSTCIVRTRFCASADGRDTWRIHLLSSCTPNTCTACMHALCMNAECREGGGEGVGGSVQQSAMHVRTAE